MIISDLQHIKSATKIEVQGGCGYSAIAYVPPVRKQSIDYYSLPCNVANADAGAQAFGTNTRTFTATDTLVIQGQFSGSRSSSFAEAS